MAQPKKSLNVSFNALLVSYLGVILSLMGIAYVFIYASPNSQLSQQITAGTLTADIRDNSGVTVASPAVSMTSKTFSFNCFSSGTASTGTLGVSGERLYVDNPDAADGGWTLTVAATSGATTLWQNGGSTVNFDFNDPGGSGCTDGGDADSRGGQLTIDPSGGSVTADCSSCTNSNISLGSSAAFNQGTLDSITILNASASSNDVGRWYFLGGSLSQSIPAEQPADTYTISLTITATAS